MSFIKWIIGALGFLFGGGIWGGLAGYAAGSLLERLVTKEYEGVPNKQADFSMSLLVLASSIMRQDGVVMRSELEYVKTFFARNFGVEHANSRLEILKELLKTDVDVESACNSIRFSMNYASRVQLLHYLFSLAASDKAISEAENRQIHYIAQLLMINEADYKTIEAMYYVSNDSSYTILQVEKTASDEQIKRAYRKMAIKYHPDKVESLGNEAKKAAKEKFQAINNAYETIKKERNII